MTTPKSRRYCFTIHNYTVEELARFHVLAESLEKHRFIVYGLEIAPDTGTKHIQGYIELNTAQRFTFLHSYINIRRNDELLKFHVDIANGTADQNKKYTSKGGEHFEFGEPITQGTRTDMVKLKEAIKENPKNLDHIIDSDVTNFQQLKFAQSIQSVYFYHRNPSNPPVVYWISGSTGAGKTFLVYRNFADICSVSNSKWPGAGYNQNECLLFDDFREFDISFNELLKITDRYPYTLERKHGHIPLNSPYIVFTSPFSIDQTFGTTSQKEDLRQLKRRIIELNLDYIKDVKSIDLKNLDDGSIHKT